MAPCAETLVSSFANFSKPPRLSKDVGLHRTVSDISPDQLSKEVGVVNHTLQSISEVEDAKCECCGMSEECTPEYISRVRERFFGKWICGLCAEAVKEEVEKTGGKMEDALGAHMSACVRFNKHGRAFPVLCQAEAMREILKKSTLEGKVRAKSISPRDKKFGGGGIARSSSCIPAITRETRQDLKIAH